MLNISGLATSLLQSVPDAVSKAPSIKDFHFANSIVQGAKLRMSGSWLNDQKARLNPGQMKLLNVAMAAIGGHEAVSDIRQDDMGGHFNLARPSYGAASVAYQREKPFSDILSFLGVNDLHGKSLLNLCLRQLGFILLPWAITLMRPAFLRILSMTRRWPGKET